MSVTATRSTVVVFSGDTVGTQTHDAADNIVSPGAVALVTLASGANTVTIPVSVPTVVTAVTIVPPVGNLVQLTLKGVAGDTGILLHLTDPTVIALSPSQVTFVLNAASICAGVRLIWS